MEHNEIRETVTNSERVKIIFTPKTSEEKQYLDRLNIALSEKRSGDWVLVAEILGISSKNAEQAFIRVFSKHHEKAVVTLEKIIQNRKYLLKTS